MRHIMTQLIDLMLAGLLHWKLEVDILTKAHLFTHQGGAAYNTQLVTLIL